jgi:hypothetical protein
MLYEYKINIVSPDVNKLLIVDSQNKTKVLKADDNLSSENKPYQLNYAKNETNYIIQEREFIGSNIYKIGKTKQPNLKRTGQYPKGSIQKITKDVPDCDSIKREIIRIFDNKFHNRRDIGREYYEGDYDKMETDFLDIIKNFNSSNREDKKVKNGVRKDPVKIVQ